VASLRGDPAAIGAFGLDGTAVCIVGRRVTLDSRLDVDATRRAVEKD
jgi:hypothetical protein